MRKYAAIIFVMVLLMTIMPISSFASEFNLINNTQYSIPLINALANVQRVSGSDAETVLTGENAPGVVLAKVSELSNVESFVQCCVENQAVPTFSVIDTKEAQRVIDAMEATSCKDVTVISSNPTVLQYVRNKKVIVRTGLEISLEHDTITSDEAHHIRTSVRSAPATFCVIDHSVASRSVVSELQELAVAVWVVAGDTETSILKAVTSGANGVITSNAFETASLMNQVMVENTMARTPVMIGHRGNPTQAPENSLSGFLKAYENGADVFEIDVEIAKDGEIIIMHDNTLNRTTDYTGNLTVNNMTLAEIQSYHIRGLDGNVTDETVPTFRDVLEAFQDKDCRIFIEFKGYNQQNVPEALALVKEYGMEDRVDVISFNTTFLKQTQKEIEGMSTGYLHAPSGSSLNALLALETFYSSIVTTQDANSTINPGHGVVNENYMKAATDRGMTVWPWTYSKSTVNRAFLVCPDGITTDDVQWSKDMLKYIETDNAFTVMPRQSQEIAVMGTTYGRVSGVLDPSDLIIQVIDGADVVRVDDGKIVAERRGEATVLCGVATQTTDGSEYVLYTQPLTVTVTLFTPLMIALMIAAVVLVLGVCMVVLICKKK